MSADASQILEDFREESKILIDKMLALLRKCEKEDNQGQSLEEYGQLADRIMGAAKTLALNIRSPEHLIHRVSDYTALCKAVGYKGSQIRENTEFFNVVVAFLMDATEMLRALTENLTTSDAKTFDQSLTQTFLERLKWISAKFGAQFRDSLDVHRGKKPPKMDQEGIDTLMKKLGLF